MSAATDFTLNDDLHEVAASPVALREHIRHLEKSLHPSLYPTVQVSLLGELGVLNRILGDLEKAEMHLRQALGLIEQHGLDARFSIHQRLRLGTVLQWQRRFNQSNVLFEELIEECTNLPDGSAFLAFALQQSGKNLFDQGRYEEALENFEAAFEIRNTTPVSMEQIQSTEFAIRETKKRLATKS